MASYLTPRVYQCLNIFPNLKLLKSNLIKRPYGTQNPYKAIVAKKYVIERYFDGLPKETDLKVIEEELRPLKDGEFLAQAVYLSVDPYMRTFANNLPIGSVMVGAQVAKITESKNKNFPAGKYVVGRFNWRTHTIHDGKNEPIAPYSIAPFILPDMGELPLSLGLGILGMPRLTSYFAFLDICKPKAEETVVISGAAGAVGSHVGQIAKIKGCKAIGIVGSNDKGQYLTNELGFDGFVNYKSKNMEEQLVKATPNGIDCYFDNVAGEISTIVMKHMNMYGRISICGSSSSYNVDAKTPPKVSSVQLHVLNKQLKMTGFLNLAYVDRNFEAVNQNLEWVKQGRIKYKETVTEGFQNMIKAFIELLEGKNTGKAIVKA